MTRLRAVVRAAASPVATARAIAWAWSAAHRVKGDLRHHGLDGIARIERSPAGDARHRTTVSAVLRLTGATCLVRSAVLQRWDADHHRPRHLVVGVSRRDGREIVAHAWLEGDGGGRGFVALHRRPPAFG